MVLLGSGVTIEQSPPPPPRMEDVRRELDAAVLQAKKHYIRRARERHTEEDTPVKRYMYAVTVMRNDRFFSLHSGRRSRSLTRVYVEEREQRSRSAVPALPRKNGFVEEENDDGSLRLEWHETIEGRKADVLEDDVTATTELIQTLPYEYREWEHEVTVQEPSEATTVWRVGDHLFSFEEPFDLSVKLPDQVHYFFTGEHLSEKRRLYTSLPNLSTVGLVESAAFDHSAHSFYGHGFRQVGNTFLSRTMESLNDDRLNIGTRPAIHEIRGEPPPQRYFPLRACMSPSRGVRSPPPSYEEWRRSPSPGYSRYTSCNTSGLDIIGRNTDRPTSVRREPQPRPRHIVERELGEEFDRNLTDYWQLQTGDRDTTVHSDRPRENYAFDVTSSGISSWAPSVPPLSEDVGGSTFGLRSAPTENIKQTGSRVSIAGAEDTLITNKSHSLPGTMVQKENERRKAALQNRTKFRRKDTPYYNETFFSSLEDELESENIRYTSREEDQLVTPSAVKENPERYTSTKKIYVEDVSKKFPVFRADYGEKDRFSTASRNFAATTSFVDGENTFSDRTSSSVRGIADDFQRRSSTPPQQTSTAPKSIADGRIKIERTKGLFQTVPASPSRQPEAHVAKRYQPYSEGGKHYTLVSATGNSPQEILEPTDAQRPFAQSVDDIRETYKWEVESAPPLKKYVTSPESEEVTTINFPPTLNEGPSVKKFKTVETEEVVQEIFEEWEIVANSKVTAPALIRGKAAEVERSKDIHKAQDLHMGSDGVWRRQDAPPAVDHHGRKREHDSDVPLGSPVSASTKDVFSGTGEVVTLPVKLPTSPRRHRQSPFDFSKFKESAKMTAAEQLRELSVLNKSEAPHVRREETVDTQKIDITAEQISTFGWNSDSWDENGYPKFRGKMYTVAEVLKTKELPYSVPPSRSFPAPEYPERLRSSVQEEQQPAYHVTRRRMSGNALGESMHWFAPGEQGTVPAKTRTRNESSRRTQLKELHKFVNLAPPTISPDQLEGLYTESQYSAPIIREKTCQTCNKSETSRHTEEMEADKLPNITKTILSYPDSRYTQKADESELSKEAKTKASRLGQPVQTLTTTAKYDTWDAPVYPKQTDQITHTADILHASEMKQETMICKRRDISPYPDHKQKEMDSHQLLKEPRDTPSSQDDQQEYLLKTTAERFPVPNWTKQHDLWDTRGYPKIIKGRSEDITETLKSSEMGHQMLLVHNDVPSDTRHVRSAEDSLHTSDIYHGSDYRPGYFTKTVKTIWTPVWQANKYIWDKYGYPKKTQTIDDITEILKTSTELETTRLPSSNATKRFSRTETESDDEAIRRYREKPQRESQALNMMIGFGDLDEPRKMKWDYRGYPAFEIAQEIHETIAPRELEHMMMSVRTQEIPAYPGRHEFDSSTGIRIVHKGLPHGTQKLNVKEALKTACDIPLMGHHKRRAPEPPTTEVEDEYAVIIPKEQRMKRRDIWNFRGYPKSTEKLAEPDEKLKHFEFEETPLQIERSFPIPAYPARYSSYDRLLETPSMVQSKLGKTTKAPPIPEHYKKPPPPYELERHRPQKHMELPTMVRDIIPDEPVELAPPPQTHLRTDSDLARRDFNAVFLKNDGFTDDDSSEKKISSSDVEEMERMLHFRRPPEHERSLDDWEIAEEIVDNSLKTAIGSRKEDYRNPSTTTVLSFDMEEPSLGGRRSDTDSELPIVSQGSLLEKDYGKGLQEYNTGHHRQKGLFGFFSKKKQESIDEQFIEEVPYRIQMEAQDRPDLYRTQPQGPSQPHHGFLYGVKEKIWKKGSGDEGRQVGHVLGIRRSRSHDETAYEEQTRHVHFLEEPKRKRSSSVHEVLEGTKKNLVKAKGYVLEFTHKGKKHSQDAHRKPSVEVVGYEPGSRELPVDVPITSQRGDAIDVISSSQSKPETHHGGRFKHFVPKWSRPRRTSSSSEDPDDIRNILPRVIQEKNDTIERMEHSTTHNVESSYTSASTVEVGSGVQDATYHAVPVHVTENEPVYATSSHADLYTDRSVHHTEVLQKATEMSDLYNPYYQEASTVSADYYAEPPSPEHNKQNESMVVQPPSPELQRSAEKFAADFTEKLAKVEDVLREADYFIKNQQSQEKIYDSVYEERIYDDVPVERFNSVPPPVPVSPIPRPREELHYASVAIATDHNLYKDDENIYEEIGDHIVESSPYATTDISNDNHVVESSAYAHANLYNAYETPSSIIVTKEEPIYSEVPKEDVFTKVVHKVEHSISHLKQKFESHSEDSHYQRVEAPKRKDFFYDENSNAQIEDQQLIRTPEATESTSTRVVYREVKPYVGSPTFNKLQKKFFPEDLAERQAQRDREEIIDVSVLNSPTTVVTNNGVTETEYRAYDKNQYEDSNATLVMKSPVDVETARTTLAIRRMSRNNQWSEDESESPRLTTTYFDYNAPASPSKISPLPSPRAGSVSPRYDRSPSSPRPESPKIETRVTAPIRPTELHISVDHHRRASPVDRVVSTEDKAPHSPEILYQSGFVKEKRKLFENGGAPTQSYAPVVKLRTTATRTSSVIVKTAEVKAPPKVHEAVSSPAEVELKRVVVGQIGTASVKQAEEGTKRKSVLEMRREYEASMQQSQVSSTTSSPHRSRANSRRRTGEIEIGTGASLSKYSEEQSSAARRTVHRTLEKHMKEETVSVPVGQGVQVSIERRMEPTVSIASTTSIGHGAIVKETTVTASSSSSSVTIGAGTGPSRNTSAVSPSSSVGYGAIPTSAPPPLPEQVVPVQPQVTVEFPLEVAQPIKETTHRESNTVVEEEPTSLQRNGSGRRSWTVKTYENNIRFDNQKLKMPDVDYVTSNGHITNGVEKMNGEENASLKDWDPRPLVGALYEVSYNPRLETKRNRFVNMEGHVDVPSDETNTLAELEREWKQQYMRTKEGRLQIFVSHCAEEAPAEDIVLSGCEVDANRDERTLTIHGGRDHIKMLLRVPSSVFDKWRQALLSHAASSQIDAYVKPVHRTMEHLTERVVIIEIGSCSIRGGRLTQETSLPQSFFPAIAIRTDDGKIIVGEDAFAPQVRHRGEFVRPIQASDPAVERYTMDKDVVKACMKKVVSDLQVDPTKYKVLLSIPQNIPIVLISELVTIALQDIKFQGAAITRQPSLILYAYDVTTGVVVDIGDRLNIVPVIDGYVVDSAICSIPYGATQVREALRSDLCANNKGLYSFQSPIEKLILRYAMEQVLKETSSSYVPEDYGKEEKSGVKDVMVTLEPFNPTPGMQTKFSIDSSRFTCTEGLFRPKKWGLDTKGLHHLVHEAVQMSPIDSRRTLYRNIYLAGGASLLPGLAEKLEQELANIVPNTIHTQVHISPWRYNAAYLGAQVVASSSTFEDKCVTAENLQKFLFNLSTSTF